VFQGVINSAMSAATALVDKYLARASVVVPFVVAAGFATVAASLALIERLGATSAFWIMAAVFLAIGLAAGTIVTLRERRQQQLTAAAEEHNGSESGLGELGGVAASAAATRAASQLPIGTLLWLIGSPSASAQAVGRGIARNIPAIVLLALIALLFWPTEDEDGTREGEAPATDEPDAGTSVEAVEDDVQEAA
jgi:hypothetical protein